MVGTVLGVNETFLFLSLKSILSSVIQKIRKQGKKKKKTNDSEQLSVVVTSLKCFLALASQRSTRREFVVTTARTSCKSKNLEVSCGEAYGPFCVHSVTNNNNK